MTRRLPCVVALLAHSACVHAEPCVIRLAYNEISAPPYYFGDAGKTPPNPGPAIELVDMAAAQLGCKMVWQRKPLKRIIRELEYNAIDATLALSYSKERTAFSVYPMKGGVPDTSLVGANAGYSVVGDLTRLGIAVEEAQGDLNNLGKLANDRIEAYAGQSLFVDKLREQTEYQGIEKLAPSIVRKDYFLVFSNGYYATSGDTANKLWKLIPEFKKSHGEVLDKKYQALLGNTIAIF